MVSPVFPSGYIVHWDGENIKGKHILRSLPFLPRTPISLPTHLAGSTWIKPVALELPPSARVAAEDLLVLALLWSIRRRIWGMRLGSHIETG